VRPICIVGMHRSGTSMVAHLLHDAGVYLGPEEALRQAGEDNLDGFWENPAMVEVNDAILAACGGAWDVPPAKIPRAWKKRVPGLSDVRLAATLALNEYGDRAPWGWKDPRTSLTGNLWHELVPDLFAIVCLRNPLEVALSLARRNYLSYAHGVSLWEEYNRRLLAAFPRDRRVVTHYDAYFEDPERELARVLTAAGLDPALAVEAKPAETVATGLRHQSLTLRDVVEARLGRSTTALYAKLCVEAGWAEGSGGGGAGPLTEILASVRRPRRRQRPTVPDLTRIELRRLQRELAEQVERVRLRTEETERRDETIAQLQAQLEQQLEQARVQAEETARRDETIAELEGRVREVAQRLGDELTARDVLIAKLQTEQAQAAADWSAETRRLGEVITARDETILGQQAELERAGEEWGAELAARDESVRELQAELAKAAEDWSAEVQRLGEELAERDAAVARLQGELAEAAEIAAEAAGEAHRLAEELEARDAAIEARDETVETRDETIAALQAELALVEDQAAELQRLAEEVDARGAAITSLQAELSEAEPELHRLRETVARREGRLEAAEAELEKTRAELEARNLRIEELGIALGSARGELEAMLRGGPVEQASTPDYGRLVSTIADIAGRTLRPGAATAVISKGDAELLEAIGAGARHFPRAEDGSYPGFHPADGGAAINHLEAQREAGVEYLLVPSTAFWWFEHYADFRDHLDELYSRVHADDRCVIYSLERVGEAPPPPYEAFPGGNGVDVFCFPIIDWEFRFQRPQQLLTQFAKAGHRVFYVRTTFQEDETVAIVREVAENVYEIHLPGPRDLNLYRDSLDPRTVEGVLDALHDLRRRAGIHRAITIVDLPFWQPLVRETRDRFGWKLIYDCMDNHAGFPETEELMLQFEDALTREADLVITSARQLRDELARIAPDVVLLPNAVDFEHFGTPAYASELDHLPRPIIGYYGAIAAWFDVDLVRDAALARPDWSFVLIGSTFGTDVGKLTGLRNVHLLGEQPYESLPGYLYQFDVATIPFQLTPLIEATNPVKFYEYLAAGKPVVSAQLPELEAFSDFYYPANDAESFVAQIETALAEDDPTKQHARVELAKTHTWEHRYRALQTHISSWYPKASIAIVTFDNLEYTRLCLDNLWEKTQYPNFDVIVVDNASSPELVELLQRAEENEPRLKVILNEENVGFAAANNQAIAAAAGSEFMFLLNDDTVVTRGWLGSLVRYLQDERVGLVGPVTNWSGNESRIDVPYEGLEGMDEFAAERARSHAGRTFEIRMLPMYCVGTRMSLLDKIGGLDERFEVGMFEDDDFSMRVRSSWYRIVCAEDVFIHHWGRTSFSRLDQETYDRIFEENRKRYEEIWSQPWEPHQARSE
jgi:GT2 family glycosyltransferase/glycosyltransferase involved in cell wall biosynthesis